MVNNMGKIATYNRPFLSRYAVLLSIGCTLPAAPAIAQEKTEDRLERLELILAQQQQRIEELEKQLDEKNAPIMRRRRVRLWAMGGAMLPKILYQIGQKWRRLTLRN